MTNNIKVAVFGGTGFIGSYILKELSNNSFHVNALIRKNSENKLPKVNNIKIVSGDLSNISSVKKTIENCDTVIYAVGIIREDLRQEITFDKLHFEYFKEIVNISRRAEVKKIIYISANGVKPNGTKYQSTKFSAEQYLINNFDNWTIYRPSVVFGDPGEKIEFMTQLKNDIINKPLPAPLFFKINPLKVNEFFKSNPVHVNDLSKLVVKSLESDYSINTIHEVGGLEEVSWSDILKEIAKVISKRKFFVPIPIGIFQLLASILDKFQFFPITESQIKMLKQNNTCNSKALFEQYDITPIKFSNNSILYLNTK